jgi:hypothetical protein
MPYDNVPKALWGKMDRCVAKVKAKGGSKDPYAVCYASVVGKGVSDAAKQRKSSRKKGG